MSLFGSSPDDPAPIATNPKPRNSLFDEEPSPAPGSKSSLFADEDAAPGASPWGLPTPKKSTRGGVVQSLLPASDVPESYIDTFDSIIHDGDSVGGKMSAAGVGKVLDAGKLSEESHNRIVSIVCGGQVKDLGRNEFNVLLALIGLAQENEDVTLDGVDERRKDLPHPKLPGLTRLSSTISRASELSAKAPQRPVSPPPPSAAPTPQKAKTVRQKSLDFPEADPWGSPALHKGHNHDPTPLKANGARPTNNAIQEPVRTTSTFTTTSTEPRDTPRATSESSATAPVAGVWGSYDGNTGSIFNNSSEVNNNAADFGGTGDRGQETPAPTSAERSYSNGRVARSGVEENVIVTLLPEKEGMFMFQHHNYQVASSRRGSNVVRRYSDFVWLLDCLQKRYPFRQLPLLPPKRVGVNGNHLAADSTFIEKRRRGLARFANALVRHPVLNQEQLVIMFLTVPTELAVWRKQATISVQEEFVGKPLPHGLEDSLSSNLSELFDTTRSGVRRSADIYINLCNLMDRLCKRNEGLAADHARFSSSLQSLTDASQETYASETNDVPLLNEGLQATAKHVSNSQSLLEDEARAWDQGVQEDLKRQRDALVSMRDMFDRRDKYDKNNIPQLERKIEASETKLAAVRTKPAELIKPGEIEKITESIIKDKEAIVAQHARGVFIKQCLRDELLYFQQSQFHVSRWNQDWAQERVKYSELQADNWKQLHEELESMPIGD